MTLQLSYPEGIEEVSNNAASSNDAVSFIRFGIFERTAANSYMPHADINLYMPETLSNPMNVSWDTQSMGPAGSGQDRGLIDSNLDRFNQSLESLTQSMTAKLYGGTEASGQDILADREQKIVNPYLKMLFRGINFRNFEFSFKFTPHTVEESDRIWKIIQQFRQAALPEADEGGFKWKYPREVEIKYIYQGRDHPWLNKFKRCVITDCNVNYTSSGFYASMRNGFPAETELRLQFSEIELLTRKDIGTENGPSF